MTDARQVIWIASSKADLKSFPEEVRAEVGHALYLAQIGEKSKTARPWRGHHGASVLEIREDFDSDTYRVVYTIRFKEGSMFFIASRRRAQRESRHHSKILISLKAG